MGQVMVCFGPMTRLPSVCSGRSPPLVKKHSRLHLPSPQYPRSALADGSLILGKLATADAAVPRSFDLAPTHFLQPNPQRSMRLETRLPLAGLGWSETRGGTSPNLALGFLSCLEFDEYAKLGSDRVGEVLVNLVGWRDEA